MKSQTLRDAFTIAVLGVGALTVVATIGGGIAYEVASNTNNTTVTATVTDKVVKNSGNNSKYLIFTDKGVKEDTDNLFHGKFNSSDVYSALKVGCTYQFNQIGVRNDFFSMYPDILTSVPVPTKACPNP